MYENSPRWSLITKSAVLWERRSPAEGASNCVREGSACNGVEPRACVGFALK